MAYTTIDKGSKYFNTVLYTGNGSARTITGVGFQPDWVWIKERSASASAHNLSDAVRGAGKALFSNTTDAEYDYGTGTGGNLRSFDSDGFSLGTATQTNDNGTTFVSWNWDANGAGVSNTSGSITSTVSANTTSGFSIVSYTGNGTNGATIGHGLGVAPKMVIPKCRSDASTDWSCYHASLSASNNIFLSLTQAQSPIIDRANGGISTTSSTTFTVAQGSSSLNSVNGSSKTYIAYCFAEVKGFSKFGSYTGNGSTDGTFVYTGFKPAFVMMKNASASLTPWFIFDVKRDPSNETDLKLNPNSTDVESSANPIDILSNGFKLRTSGSYNNGSGNTIIYMAFAENPFVSSKGIPTTAR